MSSIVDFLLGQHFAPEEYRLDAACLRAMAWIAIGTVTVPILAGLAAFTPLRPWAVLTALWWARLAPFAWLSVLGLMLFSAAWAFPLALFVGGLTTLGLESLIRWCRGRPPLLESRRAWQLGAAGMVIGAGIVAGIAWDHGDRWWAYYQLQVLTRPDGRPLYVLQDQSRWMFRMSVVCHIDPGIDTPEIAALVRRLRGVVRLYFDELDDLERWGEVIAAQPRLGRLGLSRTRGGGQILPQVGRLTNLTNLTLYDETLQDDDLEHLGGLKQLEHMMIMSNRLTGRGFKRLPVMPSVTSLSLFGDSLNQEVLIHLDRFPDLRTLSVNVPRQPGVLAKLPSMPKLIGLYIRDGEFASGDLDGLRHGFALRSLGLDSSTLRQDCLAALPATIEYLHLDMAVIEPEVLAFLPARSQAFSLFLNDSTLDDAGLAHLASLSFDKLAIVRTCVTEASLPVLIQIAGNHQRGQHSDPPRLDVGYGQLSDEAIAALEAAGWQVLVRKW